MTFLAILIALLLERIAPNLVDYRHFRWLRGYSLQMNDLFRIERLGAWLALIVLILPLLLAAWFLSGIFENSLSGLFNLVFEVFIVFMCLGPRDLDKEVEQYLDAIEIGDDSRKLNAASRLTGESKEKNLDDQVSRVCKSLFVEANRRIFAILFWFALIGPVAAVLYRLLQQFRLQNIIPEAQAQFKQNISLLIGLMDWIPARISLFAFMLSGSFEEGLKAFRAGCQNAVDVYDENHELLQKVGYHALSLPFSTENMGQGMDLIRKSRGLILRSLTVWLLIVFLFDIFS